MTARSAASDQPFATELLSVALLDTHAAPLTVGSLVAGEGQAAEVPSPPRISPATGQPLFVGVDNSATHVEAAVQSAHHAATAGSWARATGRERATVLRSAAERVDANAEALAGLLVAETGKPIREARGEVGALVNSFEYFAGLARDINGRTARDIDADLFAFTLREPAGVAALVVPFNFPLGILGQKLPPALAAGCSAVVKPSPLTPLSALAVAELLYAAGLPADALSVILAEGEAGAALVNHPLTDVVSFTGSTAVGRRIAADAGSNRLKRVAIEAGGKTPVIVTANADLDETVEGLLFASFFNQGQVCVAGSRVLADERVAEDLARRLAGRADQIRLGDPTDVATEMGPLISVPHFETVQGAVERSVEEGAQLLTGGVRATPAETGAHPFLRPTVLYAESDENHSVAEELFGPVTTVQSFRDLDEVVERANAQQYGLAASIWTQNINEALDLTLALDTGTVWVNGSTDSFPELPLGGRRDSGYEPEFGREGMEFFTQTKTVQINRGAQQRRYGGTHG